MSTSGIDCLHGQGAIAYSKKVRVDHIIAI